MKSKMDIIKLHDIMTELLHNKEINSLVTFDQSAKDNMLVIKRTLCWILEHDEGRWIEENMATITKALKDLGFELHNIQ